MPFPIKEKLMKMILFRQFATGLIVGLRDKGRYGTAHVYGSVLRSVTEYADESFCFQQMTPTFLKEYEQYLIHTKGLKWNTSSTYLRCLQAIYNKALESGVADFIPCLFKEVFTGVMRNHRRALPSSDMRSLLMNPDNPTEDEESHPQKEKIPTLVKKASACLELMLRLRGLSFIDLAFLKKNDYSEGYLTLRRQKTGTALRIRVSQDASRLIHLYCNHDPDSPYLLDILNGKLEGYAAYCDYQSKLRNLNVALKRLAAYSHVQKTVSSYCARHPWATQAKYCGIPIPIISEGLGHTSITTTEAYLKSFDNYILDSANERVIDYIFSGNKQSKHAVSQQSKC